MAKANRGNEALVKFYGSRRFIEGMQAEIVARAGVPKYDLFHEDNVWGFCWQSLNDIRKIYAWMMPTQNLPFLSRKRKTFEEILGI